MQRDKREKIKKSRDVPVLFWVIAVLCAICGVLHRAFIKSPAFSDKFNVTAGYFFRMAAAKISGITPFSLAEFLLFSSLVLIVALTVCLCRYAGRGKRYLVRSICFLLCIPMLIYSEFVIGFASGYRGAPLEDKLSLERKEVSAGDLYHTQMIVVSELNSCSDNISFAPDGFSVMPYGWGELNKKICTAYGKVCAAHDFINDFSSGVKPLVISKYMTYTHLSGIYTFFTGEANINTNYPEYVTAFTAAHEMAHQRGISKEDEANFIAFLVCTASDDPYLRYCGYLNMYEYLAGPLYSADTTLYSSAAGSLDPRVRTELKAYSEFFDKYRDSTASEVSDKLNDAYLQSQGTAGVKSYGMVVDLAVAYYKQ